MDYKEIIKSIQSKKFEKIYLLHGEEPFYIDLITDAILENALLPEEKDFNQTIVYGKDCDLLSIISDAKSYPMFSERRVVVIKEAQDFKAIDELEAYFKDPSEQTIFVINYKYKNYDSRKKAFKAASKNGLIFKSEKVKEYKLVDWISTFTKNEGYGISQKAAMLLAEFLGDDLSRIANEIEKLKLLVEKGTTINDIHIEENIGVSKDYNIFELSNAISVRDVTKAFKIVEYFEHNPKAGPLVVVVNNLFSHFSRLMKIHFLENKSKEGIATALKVHPFVGTQLVQSSRIYSPKKIAANISILHEYDLKSKGIGNSNFTEAQLMKELVYQLMH